MKVRLQRFMADCGVASRRECEEMIQTGRVRVNGVVETKMPVMIVAGKDIVTVDDEKIMAGEGGGGGGELTEQQKVYFLLNKPKGILVTNYDPADRKTVGELMVGVKERVFPVGRLDMDSRGALIMTNDGELANRLTHPRYSVEKTYIVEVDGRIGPGEIEKLKRGIWLGPEHDGQSPMKSERAKLRLIGRERGRTILEVKLAEGKNSEIRRVMARIGHVVRDLNRVSIAGKVTIENLKVGAYRALSEKEVEWLYHASSPEFHGAKRAATQAWYEAKEMEKERKRIATEAAEKKPEARSQEPEEGKTREFRPRPERKGRKPFVPPTGRNAGKALGGNMIGRKRMEQENRAPADDEIKGEVRSIHPLGDAAQSDE